MLDNRKVRPRRHDTNMHTTGQVGRQTPLQTDRGTTQENMQAISDEKTQRQQAEAMRSDEPRPGEHQVVGCGVDEFLAPQHIMRRRGDSDGYAWIGNGARRSLCRIGSKKFEHWLFRRHLTARGDHPSPQKLEAMIQACRAWANELPAASTIFNRVARHEDTMVLDLARDCGQVAVIDAKGWSLAQESAAPFVSACGDEVSLPVPQTGGSLEEFKKFFRVAPEDIPLLLAALCAFLKPEGPYPLLILHGEKGTAKSTTMRMLKRLIDPSGMEARALPSNPNDLLIAAKSNWLLAFDNISQLSTAMSDALCRLSTGGGIGKRKLYTDEDEHGIFACRPVILNGITEFATRPDLLDRAISLHLPVLPDTERKREIDLWREFDEAQPRLLGLLLDAVATGLGASPGLVLPELPRMADFAHWGCACLTRFGFEPETLLDRLEALSAESNQVAFEADAVAQAAIELMAVRPEFRGTASQLLELLHGSVSPLLASQLPKLANQLSAALRRGASTLREHGVEFVARLPGSRREGRKLALGRLEGARAVGA